MILKFQIFTLQVMRLWNGEMCKEGGDRFPKQNFLSLKKNSLEISHGILALLRNVSAKV